MAKPVFYLVSKPEEYIIKNYLKFTEVWIVKPVFLLVSK